MCAGHEGTGYWCQIPQAKGKDDGMHEGVKEMCMWEGRGRVDIMHLLQH